MRRGPLPPNSLANPSHLLATLARNAIANTVTTVGGDQSQLSNVAALSSSPRGDNLPAVPPPLTSLPLSPSIFGPPNNIVKQNPSLPPPPPVHINRGLTENDRKMKQEDEEEAIEEDELKIVRKNLEALSKKDLNLLKSSRSRLYDFPTQVPTVLSSAYSTPQQNV